MAVATAAYTQNNGTHFDTKVPLPEVDQIILPALDNDALREQELQRRADTPDAPPRFAEVREVTINPTTHGTWEDLPDGTSIWRFRVISREAYSINFGFRQYYMPEGGTFHLYAPGRKKTYGPFTPADNEAHEQLWTPVVPGQDVTLEVQLPTDKKSELRLQLNQVNHDFMNFFELSSGACHLDVVCGAEDGHPLVDQFRDAIQSVAVYSFGGSFVCTGFLVNNTQGDCTPYFMTATHCGVNAGNAPSMVVYWNYENNTCREPRSPVSGGLGDGPLDDFNTGAIFRAEYALSDFTLVELDDPVSPTANAVFAGWNAASEPPSDTVATVHHPGTEEKRISFRYDGAYVGAWGSATNPVPNGDALIISNWDVGSTEGGSSGAPLFDSQNRVIGQLRGGTASCNINGYDVFGWFHKSWTGGGTATSSLRPWLDPSGSEQLTLDGKAQSACNIRLVANVPAQQVCAPTPAVFEIEVSENFTDLVQLTLSGLPENAQVDYSQNPVIPGNNTTITINSDDLPSGAYTLTLTGTDGMQAETITLALQSSAMPAAVIDPVSPAANATNVPLYAVFSWDADQEAQSYQVQIATDEAFANIIADVVDISGTSLQGIQLEAVTTYFWRVRGNNTCGEGAWSSARRFTTADIICASVSPENLPEEIFDLLPNVTISSVEVDLPGGIVDIRLTNLNIRHSWVGDMQVALTSPQGTSVRLFDRPGVPADDFGCDGRDVLLNFFSDAPNTPEQLESTCGDRPAIAGDYQPLDPFSFMFGENAIGEWRLTVEDFAPDDGGAINAWTLEVCTARPKDIGIKAANTAFAACSDETTTFDITLGTDFDENNGVTLSASGLPDAAAVNFSANPARPGDTVQVTISNLTGQDVYTLVIEATDGIDDSNIELQLVVSDVPNDFELRFPANAATNIPLSTSLEWDAPQTAEQYFINITDEQGTSIASDTIETPLFFVSGLRFGTTYTWSIQAMNNCGLSEPKTFSFTTVPDVSFSVSPMNINACRTDQPGFNLNIGPGYGENTTVTYTVAPEQNIPISFNADPNNLPTGTTVRATLSNLGSVPIGEYTITFQISDGTYSNQDIVTAFLRGVPAVPTPQEPADGASFPEQRPTLRWRSILDATSYRLEIARDDRFSEMVATIEVADTSYAFPEALEGGRYHWRVTSLNDCGFSTSGIFDFFVEAAGIQEWQGQRVTFHPNPTSGWLRIQFAQPLSGNLTVELFNTNGQLLQRQYLRQADTELNFDLTQQASGMYLIRLVNGEAVLTQRILVQK